MDYSERWKKLKRLGAGGQGEVFQVLDTSKFSLDKLFRIVKDGITPTQHEVKQWEQFEAFRQAILDFHRMEDSSNHGALKVLHLPVFAKDGRHAEERIRREIKAMREVAHPNLLKILDADPDSKWFVSEYHPKGSLDDSSLYRTDLVGALKAFRPLVEAVAKLHAAGYVHRDIKPHNVFLALDGRLVLGDFGLVFYDDEQHTRISETFQNVGSRDWMPGWAMGIRVDQVRPTLDVFSLGKLLWAMISPGEILPLWYYNRPQFDLEKRFPAVPYIHLAKRLFQKCIVENEEDCLPDASTLLKEVDEVLLIIDSRGDLVEEGAKLRCKACSRGYYETFHGPETQFYMNIRREWEMFVCTRCGNVQLFLRERRK